MTDATAFVVRAARLSAPQTAITIAVDTAYVGGQAGKSITQGIYMMDNQLSAGSTGEGTLDLNTHVMLGSLIGFNVVPINPDLGDQVIITGFAILQGNVFGSSGYPEPLPPLGSEPAGSYWIGQAMNQGNQTYQLQLELTVGQIRPVKYYVNCGPCSLTAS
ncbi:MAG TPA: hypothetical protein VF527_21920 [Pyrinomonadaceae bacterium]|jgi:hypothetical protein